MPQQKTKKEPIKAGDGNFFNRPYVQLLIIAGLAIITWLFLKVCLNNQLTNWDDPGYIKDNALIKDISAEGIKNIFSLSNPIMGNYHPLTILTYAIEYSYAQLRPEYYYFIGLLVCESTYTQRYSCNSCGTVVRTSPNAYGIGGVACGAQGCGL